jgi:hypothetical protein
MGGASVNPAVRKRGAIVRGLPEPLLEFVADKIGPLGAQVGEKVGAHLIETVVVAEAVRVAIGGEHDEGGNRPTQGLDPHLEFVEGMLRAKRHGLVCHVLIAPRPGARDRAVGLDDEDVAIAQLRVENEAVRDRHSDQGRAVSEIGGDGQVLTRLGRGRRFGERGEIQFGEGICGEMVAHGFFPRGQERLWPQRPGLSSHLA